MKVKRSLFATLTAAAVSILTTLPALAEGAYLYGQQAGSQVNIRSAPSTNAKALHFGFVGDYVDIINSQIGQDGYTWYYVEVSASGVKGWIRADFITFPQGSYFPETQQIKYRDCSNPLSSICLTRKPLALILKSVSATNIIEDWSHAERANFQNNYARQNDI